MKHPPVKLRKVYGRLKPVSFYGFARKGWAKIWNCLCSCGALCRVRGIHIVTGNTKSCGCLRREKAKLWIRNNRIDK